MSRNPLRQPKYDLREFDDWNRAVRRSIRQYDETCKYYPPELLYYGYTAQKDKTDKICAADGCLVTLRHLRSHLCEAHREARRAEGKRKARR